MEAINGARMDPAHLLAYVGRLPEGSMFVAQKRDKTYWREYLDIGPDYYATAAAVDAVNANTRATASWKGKPPKIDPFPVPALLVEKARRKAEQGPVTVASLWRRAKGMTAAMPGAKKE